MNNDHQNTRMCRSHSFWDSWNYQLCSKGRSKGAVLLGCDLREKRVDLAETLSCPEISMSIQ